MHREGGAVKQPPPHSGRAIQGPSTWRPRAGSLGGMRRRHLTSPRGAVMCQDELLARELGWAVLVWRPWFLCHRMETP